MLIKDYRSYIAVLVDYRLRCMLKIFLLKKLLTGRDGFPMLAPPVGVLMVSESEDWRFTS